MSRSKYHSSMMTSLWSLGRMDKWRGYYRGGGYKDAKQIGKYMVEFEDDEYDLRMFIWREDNEPCVVIVMSKEDNVAVMDYLNYNPCCTIDKLMQQGSGTREMVIFALNLMKEHGAVKVQLDDRSVVPCKNGNVSLSVMYFFKNGETWYEKYFGFKPVRFQKEYENAKKIQKTLGLEKESCEYFQDNKNVITLINKIGFDFNRTAWEVIL